MDLIFLLFLICFGVGFLFAVISAFAADLFGGTHEVHIDAHAEFGHAEAGFGSHDMPGFSPLSPTVIACFITAFGGLGMVFSKIDATRSPWLAAPLAVVGAVAIAAAVCWLFRAIYRRTQSSSEGKVGELVGQMATVITPIPENGVGEIAYVQGGSRYTAPAREMSGTLVPGGATVTIARIAGTQFYVTLL